VRWGIFSFFSSTNVETKNVCPIAYNSLIPTTKTQLSIAIRTIDAINQTTPKQHLKMKATIEIQDNSIDVFIKNSIDERLSTMNVDSIIEAKINNKVSEILKRNLSDSKVENFARDRVSRIITTESLKDYTFGITNEDVLSNLESKILLMIQNSTDFKLLVKNVLKNSL